MRSGVVPIIKPPGITSQQAVSIFRRLTGVLKAGHTGTLDPAAVGVLVICYGAATRLVEYADRYPKRYRAEMTFGWSTDTQDSTGATLQVTPEFEVTYNQLDEVLGQFVGEIEQVPPMVSAVKQGGVRLYKLARRGESVEREGRVVTIHSISRVVTTDPGGSPQSPSITFGSRVMIDVECSSGTYIRTLCEDIGVRLGIGAHMSYLVRLATSGFDVSDAVTLEEVPLLSAWCEDGASRHAASDSEPDFACSHPATGRPPFGMECLVRGFPRVRCLPDEDRLINNGAVPHRLSGRLIEKLIEGSACDHVLILSSVGRLAAVGRVSHNAGRAEILLEKVIPAEEQP